MKKLRPTIIKEIREKGYLFGGYHGIYPVLNSGEACLFEDEDWDDIMREAWPGVEFKDTSHNYWHDSYAFLYLYGDLIERVFPEIKYNFDRYVIEYEFEASENLEYEDD